MSDDIAQLRAELADARSQLAGLRQRLEDLENDRAARLKNESSIRGRLVELGVLPDDGSPLLIFPKREDPK